MFGHEKFEAYHISIKFLKVALIIIDKLPSGHSALKDQLKRAAISVVLNIAEGTGKTTIPDRNRFYAMARGSAFESAAICDVVALIDHSLSQDIQQAKSYLESVAGILTAICKSSM